MTWTVGRSDRGFFFVALAAVRRTLRRSSRYVVGGWKIERKGEKPATLVGGLTALEEVVRDEHPIADP
jgi:hypothetical protein